MPKVTKKIEWDEEATRRTQHCIKAEKPQSNALRLFG